MLRPFVLLLLLLTGSGFCAESPTRSKLYIIHGYGASPSDHWFQWLEKQVERKGTEVTIVKMPTPLEPKAEEWHKTLQQIVSSPDENTFFVAHSLGCITLLRYLDSLSSDKRIGGMILVSGFSSPLPTLPQLDSFTKEPINYEHLKEMARHRIVIGARDDEIVPYAFTEALGKSLGAKIVKVEKGGHFLAHEGFTEFQLLLDELRQITP